MMRDLGDHTQVVGNTGHDMPRLGFVKVTERKFLQMGKKVRSHIRFHPDAQHMTETHPDVVGNDAERRQAEDPAQTDGEHSDIFFRQICLERVVDDHGHNRGKKR